MKTQELLSFKDKEILFTIANGEYFIGMKSVLDALGLAADSSIRRTQRDRFMGSRTVNMTVQSTINGKSQGRMVTCLPEKYVYGWILSLQSQSPELKAYKKECYDILYNYFHGTITGRTELLKKKIEVDLEYSKAQNSLLGTTEFLKIQDLKKQKAEIAKSLKSNDQEAEKEIIDLFHQPE